MTEERARYYAKALAHSTGVTFYAVRSRAGRFLAVQIPSDECEILEKVVPPRRKVRAVSRTHSEQARRAA